MNPRVEESSFRDRDGFVFSAGDRLFRAVRPSYLKTWDRVSGFLHTLSAEGKVISYKVNGEHVINDVPLVLEVEKVPFISYPSEWTFPQLKRAAILTLELQIRALDNGFSLKDASAFNIQFKGN